jgi:hypothetical protein
MCAPGPLGLFNSSLLHHQTNCALIWAINHDLLQTLPLARRLGRLGLAGLRPLSGVAERAWAGGVSAADERFRRLDCVSSQSTVNSYLGRRPRRPIADDPLTQRPNWRDRAGNQERRSRHSPCLRLLQLVSSRIPRSFRGASCRRQYDLADFRARTLDGCMAAIRRRRYRSEIPSDRALGDVQPQRRRCERRRRHRTRIEDRPPGLRQPRLSAKGTDSLGTHLASVLHRRRSGRHSLC